MSFRTRIAVLVAATPAAAGAVTLLPRIPQDPAYHRFADARSWLGVPNFMNVASNLPFLLVGLAGLWFALGKGSEARFTASAERWPWVALFLGVALTCFGSAYYHAAPSNATLLWDRLPMAVGFMGVLAALIAERIELRAGLIALPVLMTVGLFSVVYWHAGELRGTGDLRPYVMVQVFTLLAVPLILGLFPARYTRGPDLLVAVGIYGLAKLFEAGDALVFHLGHAVSGHTLKHLTAAVAAYWILRMLGRRQTVGSLIA
ncbi:MAG TPA: ceramidase domain-containing protein [Terriglobales bacterium]|nr:ceramidase domain-containing protein [Terriglobales bacterium]